MRKILTVATLLLCALTGRAQEKVMNVLKTDGSSSRTRVAELSQISFLAADEGSQGLTVKTVGGETAFVRFESNPVVTVADGRLLVKPSTEDAMEFEITDIAEILFGEAPDVTAIKGLSVFDCELRDDGVVFRGIPEGITPRVYSVDGRSLPKPLFHDGELRLSRETLGTGIFVVKIGSFATKIKF